MLESNPQYDIARRQMKGGSGMLSFDVKDLSLIHISEPTRPY